MNGNNRLANWIKRSVALGVMAFALSSVATDYDIYVGTYTKGDSRGIYRVRLNGKTGALSEKSLSGTAENPSYLVMDAKEKYLFAVNEVGPAGRVSSFSISKTSGALTFINTESTMGDGPCHLMVDSKMTYAIAANYNGGSVAVIPILPDGRLRPASEFVRHNGSSVVRGRQDSPHAHGAYLDEDKRLLYVTDLGLDQVVLYRLNTASGKLTPYSPRSMAMAPGSGPRHIAFHPKKNFAYVIHELNCTIGAFSVDKVTGLFSELQTVSTLPEGKEMQKNYSGAEVKILPNGKFLYGSTRGHDSISVFAIDNKTGKLTQVQNIPCGGKMPRQFEISPDGKWLVAANQNSDNLVVFKIDSKTGQLTATGNTAEVSSPVCVLFRKP